MKRRDFLNYSMLTAAVTFAPVRALAQSPTGGKRLFFVFLRGGMDALYAFPGVGIESQIKSRRGDLADQITNNAIYPRFTAAGLNGFRYHKNLSLLPTLG